MSAAPPHSGNVGSVPHKHHSDPPMQGSFAVPRYRPSVMYVPNTSVATGVPTIQHFNSRGELINHRRIRPTVIDLRVCGFLELLHVFDSKLFEESTATDAGATPPPIATRRTEL